MNKKLIIIFSSIMVLACVFSFIFNYDKNVVIATNAQLENTNIYPESIDKVKDNCKSFYLVEPNSNQVILEKNATERLEIASMVKIMSASIVFDKIKNNELSYDVKVNVSENASKIDGSKILLDKGSTHTVENLLKSVIVSSANDSVIALAEHISGSEENFVKLMNEKAYKLHLANTKFVNATGLPDKNQYSCAKDVAIMLKNIMQYEDYFKFCKIWLEDYVHPSGRKTMMSNTNKLIKYYKGCDAGKTGYTTNAKHCLASSAFRNNTRFIAVVIGVNSSKERFYLSSELLNFGFNNYCNKILFNKYQKVGKIKISGRNKYIDVYAKENIGIFCKNNQKIEYTANIVSLNKKSDIKKGDIVAKFDVQCNGINLSFDLISQENVAKPTFYDSICNIFANW